MAERPKPWVRDTAGTQSHAHDMKHAQSQSRAACCRTSKLGAFVGMVKLEELVVAEEQLLWSGVVLIFIAVFPRILLSTCW